jgi:hypothetical protein
MHVELPSVSHARLIFMFYSSSRIAAPRCVHGNEQSRLLVQVVALGKEKQELHAAHAEVGGLAAPAAYLDRAHHLLMHFKSLEMESHMHSGNNAGTEAVGSKDEASAREQQACGSGQHWVSVAQLSWDTPCCIAT